jgi:hypothetical protein
MGESIITRKKGGVSIPQTELPVITFVSRNDTSLTFTIRNEDDEQAIVYYELGDDTPDSTSIVLNGNTTTSNIVFSGLTPGTSYTLYVWATAFNKSVSQVAESNQTTTNTTIAPTITYISKTFDSITFNVTNNDNTTATIYYQQNVTPPTANSVVLNAGQTSSNLTISGLTKQTTYTVYAQALGTGKVLSSVVSFTETTPDFPTLTNPTITFVSKTSDSISFTLRNNASVSANIFYQHSVTPPTANFVTLGAEVTSSTITISGLNPSTSYTIYAQAKQTNWNNSGVVSITQTTNAVQGQQLFTSSGTWVAPAGVTSVSVLLVGGGDGGYYTFNTRCDDFGCINDFRYFIYNGGDLRYSNNVSVTPGQSYTITVGAGGIGARNGGGTSAQTSSAFGINAGTGGANSTGISSTILGGNGGNGTSLSGSLLEYGQSSTTPGGWNGGSGAGGYSGNGGTGGRTKASNMAGTNVNPTSGNGGGGSGARGGSTTEFPIPPARSGGGVGLLGTGSSGIAPTGIGNGNPGSGGVGALYGGGGGSGGNGSPGAVRIMWGGGRSYPSNAGNV